MSEFLDGVLYGFGAIAGLILAFALGWFLLKLVKNWPQQTSPIATTAGASTTQTTPPTATDQSTAMSTGGSGWLTRKVVATVISLMVMVVAATLLFAWWDELLSWIGSFFAAGSSSDEESAAAAEHYDQYLLECILALLLWAVFMLFVPGTGYWAGLKAIKTILVFATVAWVFLNSSVGEGIEQQLIVSARCSKTNDCVRPDIRVYAGQPSAPLTHPPKTCLTLDEVDRSGVIYKAFAEYRRNGVWSRHYGDSYDAMRANIVGETGAYIEYEKTITPGKCS